MDAQEPLPKFRGTRVQALDFLELLSLAKANHPEVVSNADIACKRSNAAVFAMLTKTMNFRVPNGCDAQHPVSFLQDFGRRRLPEPPYTAGVCWCRGPFARFSQ